MTVLEAINEYKKCIDEIAQLLFVFASVIGDDRVEAGHLTQLGWTIGEVKGYHTGIMRYDPVKRIKDAIIGDMPDKKELQKRLAYVWHELSEEVAFIEDEETGYFPVFDEKNFSLDNKELFNVLCKLESKNYAFTVLTHLEGVVLWTNIRISEVYKMLCELSDFAGMKEQETTAESRIVTKKKAKEAKTSDYTKDTILNYLRLDETEKEKWIKEIKDCTNYEELAQKINRDAKNKILVKVPSSKGGGLCNLLKAVGLQFEMTETAEKRIRKLYGNAFTTPKTLEKLD